MDNQTQINIKAHRSILKKLSAIIAILEQNAPEFVATTKSIQESIAYSPPEGFTHHVERFVWLIPQILGEDCSKVRAEWPDWKSSMIDIWIMETDKFLDSFINSDKIND